MENITPVVVGFARAFVTGKLHNTRWLLSLLPGSYPDTSLPEIHEEPAEERTASLRLLRVA